MCFIQKLTFLLIIFTLALPATTVFADSTHCSKISMSMDCDTPCNDSESKNSCDSLCINITNNIIISDAKTSIKLKEELYSYPIYIEHFKSSNIELIKHPPKAFS